MPDPGPQLCIGVLMNVHGIWQQRIVSALRACRLPQDRQKKRAWRNGAHSNFAVDRADVKITLPGLHATFVSNLQLAPVKNLSS